MKRLTQAPLRHVRQLLSTKRRRYITFAASVLIVLGVSMGVLASTHRVHIPLPAAVTKAIEHVTQPSNHANSPQVSGNPQSTSSPSASPSARPGSTTGPSISAKPATQPSGPHLVFYPSPYAVNGDANIRPLLYMSDKRQFKQPGSSSTADLYVEWWDDGQGHIVNGTYYPGWKPLVVRKHEDHDIDDTFTVTTTDMNGQSFSTSVRIIWLASRNLGVTNGGLTKVVSGNVVTFTARINFSPTPNVGSLPLKVSTNGWYNFSQTNLCDLGHTETTLNYNGQSSYDVTCAVSADKLATYNGGLQIGASVQGQWPPDAPIIFSVNFPAQ
jgi:hypothetical protein